MTLAASSVLCGAEGANVTPAVYNPDSGQPYVTRVTTRKVVVRRRTKKKSAAIIGGSAAAGAGIGALAGGKKGAAVGALVGGGSGAVYDRATHKKTVTVRQ
ncbi:MAG: hypothetical protein M3Z85_00760 [Acidobacteriota bacterium]|nr:hypothetical protein [Acidobacteriota bacterium]